MKQSLISHTPGPWHPHRTMILAGEWKETRREGCKTCASVCTVHGQEHWYSFKANQALICAAPAMKDALQAIYDAWDRQSGRIKEACGDENPRFDEVDQAIERARPILADINCERRNVL